MGLGHAATGMECLTVTVACVCGRESPELMLIERTELDGAIWQGACTCGRSYTFELANDPGPDAQ